MGGALRTGRVHYLILDEADEMLKEERGEGGSFKDQVHSIFDTLPPSVAVGLFSATMPDEVVALSNKFMREPIRILVKREAVTLAGIKQFYIHVGDREEFKLVINFITTDDVRALREIERFYSTEIDEMPKNIAEMIGRARRAARRGRAVGLVTTS